MKFLSWAVSFIFTAAIASAQTQVVGTIAVGMPTSVAVYETGNKIFVADQQSQSVLIMKGPNLSVFIAKLEVDKRTTEGSTC